MDEEIGEYSIGERLGVCKEESKVAKQPSTQEHDAATIPVKHKQVKVGFERSSYNYRASPNNVLQLQSAERVRTIQRPEQESQ